MKWSNVWHGASIRQTRETGATMAPSYVWHFLFELCIRFPVWGGATAAAVLTLEAAVNDNRNPMNYCVETFPAPLCKRGVLLLREYDCFTFSTNILYVGFSSLFCHFPRRPSLSLWCWFVRESRYMLLRYDSYFCLSVQFCFFHCLTCFIVF